MVSIASLAIVGGACGESDDGAAEQATAAAISSTTPTAAASQSVVTGTDTGTGETTESSVTDPGPNPTTYDPGPNPTTDDPGPNDTSGGPETVQGILVLDPATSCISIESDAGRLDLRFTQSDYSRGDDGAPALLDTDGFAIAHPGDTLFVAGFDAGADGDCGSLFDVESLVSVLPAG